VILTGAVLGIIELYPDWRCVFQVRSIVIALKLFLICFVPWLWSYRASILIVVLVMASISSHMPSRFRHYSVLERQEVK
jgi:hypothetical protein